MNNYNKYLLVAGVMTAVAFSTKAQSQAPMMEFHTQLYDLQGPDHSFHFVMGAIEDTNVEIDFGYGPMEYKVGPADFNSETGGIEGTTISGRVGPEGVVRIYGNPLDIDYLDIEGVYADRLDISKMINLDILNVSHNYLGELDLSAMKRLMAVYVEDNPFDHKPFLLGPDHPDLSILSIPNIGAVDQSLDLKDYPKLQVFDAYHVPSLVYCDPTSNPELLQLTLDCTNVSSLDVSNNSELLILNISQSRITEVDLSNNLKLRELYATHDGTMNFEYKLKNLDLSMLGDLRVLMASGNLFTDIDITGCPNLFHLSIQNNFLPAIDFTGSPDLYNVYISKNCMDFVTLPEPKPTFGEYYYEQRPFSLDRSYPVGGEINLSSRLNRPGSVTTARLMMGDTELGDEYYSYSEGLIQFNKATADSVHLEFSNTLFEEYSLSTSKFVVKEVADFGKDVATVTWRLKPSAERAIFCVGIAGATPENPKKFYVDPGDGNPAEYTTTSDGLESVQWYYLDKQRAGAMTLYIPEGEDLTGLFFSDTPMSTFNCTSARSLNELHLQNCALTDIDLSYNRCLQTLRLEENQLEKLDLRGADDTWIKTGLKYVEVYNNQLSEFISTELKNLTHLNIAFNKLEEIDLSKYSDLEYLNVAFNQINELDLKDCEALEYLYAHSNNLASLYIPDYTPLKVLALEANRFPLSTLPHCFDLSEYRYAPQQQWVLPQQAPMVDLSMQCVNIDGNETEFKWYTAADDRELTSAEITGKDGKFRFLDRSVGPVYATWTNAGFPRFTNSSVYRSSVITPADNPTNVVAKFTTTEAADGHLIMTSAEPDNYVYIDWTGDGDMVQYGLSDQTYTEFPVSSYPDTEVKVYSYSDRDAISVFSIGDIPMSSIDLSKLRDLHMLAVENAGLTSDAIKMPESDLKELRLSGNDVADLDLTGYENLQMLTLMDCGLTEYDATPFQKLQILSLANNELTSIKLDNPVLWELALVGNQLETLDLSGVPAMQQLWLDQNRLSSLDVSMLRNLKVLVLSNNCFTLTTLPRVLSTYSTYIYGNQALYPVKVLDGVTVDLSDQLMVGQNPTNYRWFRDKNVGYLEDGTVGGDELTPGVDYEENDGIFTFYSNVKDAVCVMTNIAFPNLIFLSEPVDIQGSGVDGTVNEAGALKALVAGDKVTVSGAEGSVALHSADGRLIRTGEAVDGIVSFNGISSGVYIVAASGQSVKILVRTN